MLHRLPPPAIARAAALYREICSDLMRARGAGYSSDVVDVLDGLAARACAALYSAPPYRLAALWELVAFGFPQAVRRNVRFVALAAALFVLPGVLGFVGASRSRGFAVQIMSEPMVAQMEKAYGEFGRGRGAGTDAMMTSFYVYNNVGIAFRCFATGILFGLGSIFFLVYNGLVIGVVAGAVGAAGHGRNLFTFVAGHGAFELSAIVLSGAAGIAMGYALVDTGQRTRWASLRAKSGDLFRMITGAALMLLVAAFIEGFWSPSAILAPVKWSVAGALYVLVLCYLVLAGRGAHRGGRA
ncbi:MAG: stage II sporulation protein M [Deltaproteobacteria bacterium]|nr:stage II sporulation protein M [Deltaproteobacteria bacterium]